jgi:hypothetical protein
MTGVEMKSNEGEKRSVYEISYEKAFEDVSGVLIYSCSFIHVQ